MNTNHEPSAEQKKYGPLFNLVADKGNWKNPINATVDPKVLLAMGATKADLGKAITFYTGSVAQISREGKSLRVKAEGYYLAIGA